MKTKEEIYNYLWRELGRFEPVNLEDRSEFDGALDKISKELSPSIIEAIPLASPEREGKDGWIVSPDFLLEIKSHLEGDFVVDLEEIETVVLALNKLQAAYRLGQRS